MTRKVNNDFVVDSSGDCFFCLSKASPSIPPDPGSQEESVPVPPKIPIQRYHSLQYLSHYLKVDMGKLFQEKGPIPPEILAKVEKSRLKVELCSECVLLAKQFSKLYGQLEKIRLEVQFCVYLIGKKLANAEKKEMLEWNGKLEILNSLRTETLQKCTIKLRSTQPELAIPKVKPTLLPPIQLSPNSSEDTECPPPCPVVDHETGRIRCNLCRHDFKNNVSFLSHYKSVHLQVKYECAVCRRMFRKWEDYQLHWSEHAPTMEPNPVDQGPEVEVLDVEMEIDDQLTITVPEQDDNSHGGQHEMQTDDADRSQILIGIEEEQLEGAGSDDEILLVENDPQDSTTTTTESSSSRRKSNLHLRKVDDVDQAENFSIEISTTPGDFEHFGRTYKCPSCPKKFENWSSYNLHRINTHIARHKCSTCPKLFKQKFYLKKHELICRKRPGEPSRPLMEDCYICGKSFSGTDSLLTHWRTVHLRARARVHECEICGKKFTQEVYLTNHRKRVHPKIRVQVTAATPQEGMVASTSTSTESQQLVPSTPRVYEVGETEITVVEPEPITVEIMSSDEEEAGAATFIWNDGHPQMELQGSSTSQGSSADSAPAFHTDVIEVETELDADPIDFIIVSSDEHEDEEPIEVNANATTATSRRVKCNHCGKVFPSLMSLEEHQIAVQRELSKFQCDICLKRFLTSLECANHRYSVHPMINKEKPNCDLCGKEVSSVVALRRHFEVVHLKVRNYACPTCGKTFNRSSGLKQHVDAVHLRIRFLCGNPGCEKVCADRSVLNKHKKLCQFATPTVSETVEDLGQLSEDGGSIRPSQEDQTGSLQHVDIDVVDEKYIFPV